LVDFLAASENQLKNARGARAMLVHRTPRGKPAALKVDV
jgi:hypothetical protein